MICEPLKMNVNIQDDINEKIRTKLTNFNEMYLVTLIDIVKLLDKLTTSNIMKI